MAWGSEGSATRCVASGANGRVGREHPMGWGWAPGSGRGTGGTRFSRLDFLRIPDAGGIKCDVDGQHVPAQAEARERWPAAKRLRMPGVGGGEGCGQSAYCGLGPAPHRGCDGATPSICEGRRRTRPEATFGWPGASGFSCPQVRHCPDSFRGRHGVDYWRPEEARGPPDVGRRRVARSSRSRECPASDQEVQGG